uniref:uncharacterized protein LOC122587244 isoform X3 n=1 Tax=Erigeron canadensis TaxID=72917 RepID=UPI001CB937E3|nr:uncharacterized protein LOC122587244 isoform X3 [Erigeron canadensis]
MTRTKRSARKSKARRAAPKLPRDHSLRPEGLVCRTCGDEGFNNAFVYCVKCLEFAVHRYCLDVIPKVLNGIVIWFCENCKPAGPYTVIFTKKQKWRERIRLKRQRRYIPLEARKEVSCPKQATKPNHGGVSLIPSPLEEALVNSDLGPSQITRCVVLGLAKCVFPNQASKSAQLDNCYPVNESALPKDEHLQIQEESGKSSLYGKMTSPKRKQINERTIAALVTAGDKISCPEGDAEPNYECVSPKKSTPKVAPVNLALGPNQIDPCVEKGIFQKQFTESAELENFSLTGSAEKKRDAMFLPIEKEKHKTQRTTDPIEHSSCDSSCTDVTFKGKEDTTPSADEQKCDIKQFDCGLAKLVTDSSSIKKELNNIMEENDDQAETANHKLKEENLKMERDSPIASRSANIENIVQHINPRPARPVLELVWRGNFSIVQTDYDLFEGLVGQVSEKACLKAIVEARTLPKLLSLQMQPKTELWPVSFSEFPPSDEQIALFFFPGSTKNNLGYKQLVTDMIDEDLAMSVPTKNAELLIFTSRVLPPSSWTIQENYYLWGVFRRKRNDGALPVDGSFTQRQ